MMPLMDYDTVLLTNNDTVVSLGGSSQLTVAGTASGAVHVSDMTNLLKLDSPIKSISVDGSSFSYCSEFRIVVVSNGGVALELGPIDPIHFPLNCVAISPAYHVSKRVIVGGATGDLLVLSQQGEPFPSSSVSRTGLPGPITSVGWQSDFVLWSGPEFGTRVLNTTTGETVYNEKSTCSYFLTNDLILTINHSLTVSLVRIVSQSKCVSVQSIALPSSEFSLLNDSSSLMSDLLAAIGENQTTCEQIVGFGLFDDSELSLTMVTRSNDWLLLHVVDSNCKDIPVSEKIVIASATPSVFVSVPAAVPFALLAVGNSVIKITRRSIEDHCMWLLNSGEFEKALDLAGGTTIDIHVANKALVPLIEAGSFDRVVSLIPHLGLSNADRWSIYLNHFLSLSSGPTLAASLAAVLPAIPYPPRDEISLHAIDYDKLITSLVSNSEWSAFELLEVVRRWSPLLYTYQPVQDALIDLVPEDFFLSSGEKAQFLKNGIMRFPSDLSISDTSSTIALILALKVLFDHTERIGDSLDILLRLRCCTEIFDSLSNVVVVASSAKQWVETNLLTLFQLDSTAASKFIVKQSTFFPIECIVPEVESQPFLLHVLLREFFLFDPKSTTKWYSTQVSLFLQFDPELLPQFVREADSNFYSLVDFLAELKNDDRTLSCLIETEALLLWKLGKAREAIELLLNVSRDVPAAVHFAAAVNDQDIWESIIDRVLNEELAPIFLKTLVELERNKTHLPQIVRPENILLKFPPEIKSDIIVSLGYEILKSQSIRSEIYAKSASILINDYLKKQRTRKCAIRIDPLTALCVICGCRVCAPPPGKDNGNNDEQLIESILEDKSLHRFTSIGSALAIQDQANGGLCHSKCLHRTTIS